VPYEPTIRTYTKRQHGSGVTVDGILLDRTMEDYVQRHMHYPRGDVATRYMPNQYVLGFEPPHADVLTSQAEDAPPTKLPFMRVNNSEEDREGTLSYPDFGENPWRHKGHNVTVIDPTRVTPANQETDQFAWTTSLAFPEPSIVDEICLVLETGSGGRSSPYDNTFIYGNNPGKKNPATQIATDPGTDWVSDIVLQMQVDSDLARTNCELADLEVNLFDWRADGRQFRVFTAGADVTSPQMANGVVDGLLIKLPRLNVPIPAGARVRFSLILPWYDTAIYDVDDSWGASPWNSQAYSLTLTTLEPIR